MITEGPVGTGYLTVTQRPLDKSTDGYSGQFVCRAPREVHSGVGRDGNSPDSPAEECREATCIELKPTMT